MARQLNIFAEEMPVPRVTLPKFNLPDIDIEAEAKEAAARIAERRVIRTGLDAWRAIGKAESFESWKLIGAALSVGKARAQRIAAEADNWRERNYIYEFGRWMRQHGFGDMKPQTRSWAIALHENVEVITAWRDSLPTGRGRRRPINPQSCVKGWQRSQANGNGHCPQNYKREAVAAWRRFCFCVAALPAAEQAAMWRMIDQARLTDVAA